MLTSLLLTFVLYLAPGWIVLNLFSVKKAPFWKRLFPALALSFISVPFFFLAVGNIIPLRAATLPGGLWLPLGVFAAVGIIVGWILKRRGRLIAVELAPAEATVSKWEKWAIWIFLILFTTIVNLPRLEMFLAGGQSGMIPLWDENWHLAELVSVARS